MSGTYKDQKYKHPRELKRLQKETGKKKKQQRENQERERDAANARS